MKVYEQLKEYIWLLNTIRKYRKISFDEIQEKWLDTEMSGGVELAKSTFHRRILHRSHNRRFCDRYSHSEKRICDIGTWQGSGIRYECKQSVSSMQPLLI